MAIIAKNTGGEYQRPSTGTVQAVCYGVVDIGFQDTPWGKKHQVVILFEINEKMKGGDYDGKRFVISKKYSLSLHPESNLGKDLRSWTGKEFKEDEQFDIEQLKGHNCLLSIQETKKNDKTYTNIATISPIMKDMEKLIPENKELPKWVIELQNNQVEHPKQKDVEPANNEFSDVSNDPDENDWGDVE